MERAKSKINAGFGSGLGLDLGCGDASLAERQAALVAALTSGAPVPPGFDERLVGVARQALLRKRAGEVAKVWPALAAAHGDGWRGVFAEWAATRPTNGSLRDGWDLARSSRPLAGAAAAELAVREARMRYDGASAPRPRGRFAASARLALLRSREAVQAAVGRGFRRPGPGGPGAGRQGLAGRR